MRTVVPAPSNDLKRNPELLAYARGIKAKKFPAEAIPPHFRNPVQELLLLLWLDEKHPKVRQ